MSIKTVAIAGSFDPMTYGHLDIIQRSAKLYEKIVVLVAENTSKLCLFSIEERARFVRSATQDLKNVKVESWNGLVVDYCFSHKIDALCRGIRTVSDYEYESSMSRLNQELSKGKLETVFLMASQKYLHVNSNMVKEFARFGQDVSLWVPPEVALALQTRVGDQEVDRG
jgi:pantetheine-phosphate adenylyltransferase